MKFEELLEKYGKTAEEITFEIEGLSDEELETKFAELFDGEGDAGDGDAGDPASDSGSDEVSDPEGDDVDPVVEEPVDDVVDVVNNPVDEPAADPVVVADEDNDSVIEDEDATPKKKKVENSEIKFELSHDDIRRALYALLDVMTDDGYCTAWINEVFDDKFIYENYSEGKCYRQKYSKDGDNIEFVGEPVEVFSEWLSKEEKDALDALKTDYAVLKSFKEQYDAAELKAQKDAIFTSDEYAEIADSDEFKALIADADKYSVEELQVKADLLFAEAMKKKFSFAAEKTEKKHSVSVNLNVKPNKKKEAYAGLFADKN